MAETVDEALEKFLLAERDLDDTLAELLLTVPDWLQPLKIAERDKWTAFKKERFLALEREAGAFPNGKPATETGQILLWHWKTAFLVSRQVELRADLARQKKG